MTKTSVLISLAFAMIASAHGSLRDRSYYEAKFYDWLQKFEHLRPKSGERFIEMLKSFADNDDIIEETNAQKLSYTLGHNEFSHLSLDEFRDYMRLGLGRSMVRFLIN